MTPILDNTDGLFVSCVKKNESNDIDDFLNTISARISLVDIRMDENVRVLGKMEVSMIKLEQTIKRLEKTITSLQSLMLERAPVKEPSIRATKACLCGLPALDECYDEVDKTKNSEVL